MERATETPFRFQSGDETLVGNLFLPADARPAGVVVAVGPLTSVKEQAAGAYAQAMSERGYAALAFDYRCFGESGGQPRHMPLREAYEFYGTARGQVPNYVNGYAVQSLAYSLPFDARGAADVLDVPVLIVHSEQAVS
jgi:fermentation-respiration switch protein FrsA (DUF1100 family)